MITKLLRYTDEYRDMGLNINIHMNVERQAYSPEWT